MTQFLRTPEVNFNDLSDFAFTPNFHTWEDLRMHYIDEGPKDAPVMLLVHGMPTWSYLYRYMIPKLVKAGYRCVAPDHMGFGRSDKPTDPHWYTIARHVEILSSLITALDLADITLVCQDWGGPIGLAQAATMPERFSRHVILNTWLHHDDYEYSDAVRNWNHNWHSGGVFDQVQPDVSLLVVFSTGLATPETIFPALLNKTDPELTGHAAEVYRGYAAPYAGLPDEGFNGYRRFPLSIPFDNYSAGNGAAQSHHYQELLASKKPSHFIWGSKDEIFIEETGRLWASAMGSSFDTVAEASHFLQDSHGPEVVDLILRRVAGEG